MSKFIKLQCMSCLILGTTSVYGDYNRDSNYYDKHGYQSGQTMQNRDYHHGQSYDQNYYDHHNPDYNNIDYRIEYKDSRNDYMKDNRDYRANQTDYRNDGQVTSSDQELAKRIRDKIGSGWFFKGYDEVEIRVSNGMVTLIGVVETWDDKNSVEKTVRDIEGVKSLNSQITTRDNRNNQNVNTTRDYRNDNVNRNHYNQENRSYNNERSYNDDNRSYNNQNRSYTNENTKSYNNTRSDNYRDDFHDTYGSSADQQLNKRIRDNVSKGWIWDSYKEIRLNTQNGAVTLEGTVDDLKDQQQLINEIQKVEGVKTVKSNLKAKNRN